jgi:thiol-disulfide isomerase/thioredoxin
MKILASLLLFSVAACASVVSDVRAALSAGNLGLAESFVAREQAAHGVSVELAFAASWVARGFLDRKDYDGAGRYSAATEKMCQELLTKRKLDDDQALPLSLGAAIEVHAQALAGEGSRDQAITYLRARLQQWRTTSIRARIQKNLNLLTLEGHPAPALEVAKFLGTVHPVPLTALRGHPVLLFFWAHWCADCKGEVPVVQKLLATYGARGLVVVGPTQHYGYVAGGMDAPAAEETKYMEAVRTQYYAGIGRMATPVSEETFRNYGVSTTPTLVLVDKSGIVRMYHPGAMSYEELAANVEKVLSVS